MKKRISCCSGVLLAGILVLSGCSNKIPEMNEEEKSMVVNYAADIVQKYNSNNPPKLQTMTVIPKEVTDEAAEAEKADETVMQEGMNEKSDMETKPADEQESQNQVTDNAVQNVEMTLDEIIKEEAFHFTYKGFETTDTYPASGTEAFFSMDATSGNNLLILKFEAANQSGSDATLDMAQSGIRFKIQINGEEKNALTTMLLNDFSNYQDVIAAGESKELVAICEIPEERIIDGSSLALTVINGDETATISLH